MSDNKSIFDFLADYFEQGNTFKSETEQEYTAYKRLGDMTEVDCCCDSLCAALCCCGM